MKFNYLARTQKGNLQRGEIEAANESAAVRTLQGYNLIIINIEKAENTRFFGGARIKLFDRVKKKEIVVFSRQLSTLVEADVPLVPSLKALGNQVDNLYFREILLKIASDVDGGMIFSKALAGHPKIFSKFYVSLIRSGEVSGRLQESLEYLADHLEKEYYLASRVRGAIIYPSFILVVFIIAGVLMMIMVVPQLTNILEETSQELPLPTKIIIWISEFLRSRGWILGLILLGLGVSLRQYIRTFSGRKLWDGLKLKLPIFGRIFKQTYLARFTENLSTLIRGGLPIIQSLDISGKVVGNVVFQEIIFEAKESVRAGESISSVLERHNQIPSMVVQMVKTGEKTGRLDSILQNLAVFYSKEVDNIVNNLSQLIEPILIILLGAMVAILVSAILMPIYNIAGGL